MDKYAEIDKSAFPIIQVTFIGNDAQDDNFPYYLEEVKQSYDHKNNLAIIFDATNAVFPGTPYQKMQAQWLKDNEQMMKDFCKGTAYIIPNIFIRNVLKTIFVFQKQPVPYLVCKDKQEAEAWIKTQLEN